MPLDRYEVASFLVSAENRNADGTLNDTVDAYDDVLMSIVERNADGSVGATTVKLLYGQADGSFSEPIELSTEYDTKIKDIRINGQKFDLDHNGVLDDKINKPENQKYRARVQLNDDGIPFLRDMSDELSNTADYTPDASDVLDLPEPQCGVLQAFLEKNAPLDGYPVQTDSEPLPNGRVRLHTGLNFNGDHSEDMIEQVAVKDPVTGAYNVQYWTNIQPFDAQSITMISVPNTDMEKILQILGQGKPEDVEALRKALGLPPEEKPAAPEPVEPEPDPQING